MTADLAQKTQYDIAIAGASFAGLALARGLRQALGPELRIALIDRAPAARAGDDGRAFAIWAGAKAVLEGLGAWDAIAGDAQTVTSIEISDSALRDAFRPTLLTYDAHTPEGLPAAYIVPAHTLHDALEGLVAEDREIARFTSREATGLELGDDKAVIAFDDGEIVSASLVVAADGRNSKLRDAAGIKTTGWPYAQTGIVALVEFNEPHGGVAIQHFLPGGPFAILPLKGNRACITWSAKSEEAERVLALDDDGFLAELDTRIGGRFGSIALVKPPRSWPLDLKVARRLIARRFALIGDAAHGVHPIAGQGVNLAFRDAAALIEVLADAARLGIDLGNGTHLERYQRWRRFDSAMSATLYDGLNRFFGVDSMVLRAGRGSALSVLDRLPSLKRVIVAEATGLSGEVPKLARGSAV